MSDDMFAPCVALPPAIEDLRLAAGTTYKLRHHDPDSFELVSSDPRILAVTPSLGGDGFDLVNAQAGEVMLTARCVASEQVSARGEAVVAAVASIDVHYRAAPGVNEPILALAGLRGQADAIAVAYLDDGGGMLRGTGSFAVRGDGAIAIVPPMTRWLSGVVHPRSTTVDVAFVELGRGELVATVGELERVLPIEVVAEPATLDLVAMTLENDALVPATYPVRVGNYVGFDAIAKTADGRYISGVPAVWQTTVGDGGPYGPLLELVFTVLAPGPIVITATVGTLTATHQVVAEY